MSDDYAPDTDDMREQFVAGAMVTGFAYSRDEARNDFHRWLANVQAAAWDEGHRFTGYEPVPGENPYRIEACDE